MRISVVVPTFNSRDLLPACLEGLLGQDFDPSQFEVVVADDGSTDGADAVVKHFARRFEARGTRLTYLRNERGGASRARNAGILAARFEVVAFTDSDCVPASGWLSAIDRHFAEHPGHLGVGGKTVSEPERITPFTHQVENNLSYSYPTCNVAYRRTPLLEVGMFEESFPYPGCRLIGTPDNEDWDITFKIESIGEIGFSPQAVVVHPPRPTTMRKLLTRTRNLESEFYLYERHPSLYRRSVHRHPLRVLLYHRALVQPALKMSRFIRFLWTRPFLYLKMLMLLCLQSAYICILTPYWVMRHWSRKRKSGPWQIPT
ncbi:MAG TPA: glycosyltransferase [bacterium]|nr:glycosyltransferase [bacterium]